MNQEQREAYITCPDCGHDIKVSIKTIDIEDVPQLDADEKQARLKNIADKTGIPIAALFTEASKVAGSLEAALPILENKYNICSTCGNLKQEKGESQ